MNIDKILQNVPDSVMESVAEKVGVNSNIVKTVISALAGEMEKGGDWIEMGKDLLDKDGDGSVIDDLGDIASSFLKGK